MVLNVVKYGHPALRQKGESIPEITPEIKKLIEDMFETMYEAHGVGLAAQQVGKALQLFVVDVREATDRPSSIEVNGKPADVADYMPLALINPSWTPLGKMEAGPEGCLSFPEIFADIERPSTIEVTGLNQRGQQVKFRCGGLLSRAIQHEYDHLQGILFIDRMQSEDKARVKPEIEAIHRATKKKLK
jgi:peptide deformylase